MGSGDSFERSNEPARKCNRGSSSSVKSCSIELLHCASVPHQRLLRTARCSGELFFDAWNTCLERCVVLLEDATLSAQKASSPIDSYRRTTGSRLEQQLFHAQIRLDPDFCFSDEIRVWHEAPPFATGLHFLRDCFAIVVRSHPVKTDSQADCDTPPAQRSQRTQAQSAPRPNEHRD